jgi:hypothetical protein
MPDVVMHGSLPVAQSLQSPASCRLPQCRYCFNTAHDPVRNRAPKPAPVRRLAQGMIVNQTGTLTSVISKTPCARGLYRENSSAFQRNLPVTFCPYQSTVSTHLPCTCNKKAGTALVVHVAEYVCWLRVDLNHRPQHNEEPAWLISGCIYSV